VSHSWKMAEIVENSMVSATFCVCGIVRGNKRFYNVPHRVPLKA